MSKISPELRDTVLGWIEADREKLVRFLSDFVAVPTPNPNGDTRAGAEFIMRRLREENVPCELRAAKEEMPNVVGTFEGGEPGRHLVLNGHIDVFPAGDAALWSRDPWSGEISDGKVHGRGVSDMKCGTSASIWTYIYLHRLRDRLKGRLTLTCVSDEETGGTWGAKWLLDQFPGEFAGDCMLNGEPSIPSMVRFGEKGTLRIRVEVSTPGAHAAYTHLSKNAIRIANRIIDDLYGLEGLEAAGQSDLLARLEKAAPVLDRDLGAGAAGIIGCTTVSVGVINGGVKINVMPGQCAFEADIRLPVGMGHPEMLGRVEAIVAQYPEATLTPIWTHSSEPTHSDPDHEMIGIVKTAVSDLGYPEPVEAVSLGATDCKHFRRAGVPSYVYGCAPNGMAQADEWVAIDEFLHVVRTHVLSSLEYLSS